MASLGNLGELLVKIGYATDGASMSKAIGDAKKVKNGITSTVSSIDRETSKAIQSASASLRSLKSTITGVLATVGVGLSLKSLNDTAEAYQKINDQILNATRGRIDQQEAEEKIMKAARMTRKSYAEMANTVTAQLKNGQNIDTVIRRVTRSMIKYEDGLYTISSATQIIKDEWGLFVADLWKSSEVGNEIGGAMVELFEATLEILKKITPMIQKLIKFFLDKIVKITTKIKSFIDKIIDSTKNLKLLDSVLETIGIALGIIAGFKILTFLATAKALLNPVLIILGLLALVLQDIWTFFRGGDSVFGDMLADLGIDAEDAKEYITGLFDGVKELVDLFKSDGAEGGKSFLEGFLNGVEKLIPLLPELTDSASEFLESLSGLSPKTGELLGDLAENVLPAICDAVTSLLDIGKQVIDEVISPALDAINESSLIENLSELGGTVLEDIKVALEPILEVAGKLIEKVIDVTDDVLPSLNKMLEAIKPLIEDLEPVIKLIGDALGVIVDAIGYIIEHAAEGATKVAEVLHSTNEEGYTGVQSQGMRKDYAVGSPSTPDTFFAGENGAELVTGARGKKVFTAMATQNVMSSLRSLAMLNPTTVSNVTNNTNGWNRNVNQNVTINNTFNGERAVQAQGATAMNKSARDATEYMANALAFGR